MTGRSEQELAATVVEWLSDFGWDVYQEVEVSEYILDIVARKGALLWAIECKVSLGAAVLGQAVRWTGSANRVSVATATAPTTRSNRWVFEDYMRLRGIGWLEEREIYTREGARFTIDEEIEPRFLRRRDSTIERFLREAQKTYAPAGNNYGARWTPFRQTCDNLRAYLKVHPGCSLKEAIDSIEHHYRKTSTARTSLAAWIHCGKVPGVKIENHKPVLVE